MKKVISILVSVMMILTAIPAFADTAATAPASVDIYEALDNFSEDELATTYTSSAPYTTDSGFIAPTAGDMNVRLMEDEEIGGFVRITPTNETAATKYGGIAIYDNNIKFGTEHTVLTATATIRQNDTKDLYWYFHKADGTAVKTTYPLRWYRGGGNLYMPIVGSYVANQKAVFQLDKWAKVTFTIDLTAKKMRIVIDGGNYDSYTWTTALTDAQVTTLTSNVPLAGFGIGWLGSADSSDNFDIADISVSTSGSTLYDEKLSFEGGTLNSSATSWSSGNWKPGAGSHVTTWAPYISLPDMGGIHDRAIKFNSGGSSHFWFQHAIPSDTVATDGVLVVEGSFYEPAYNETNYSQFILEAIGSIGGTNKSYSVLDYPQSASWDLSCMGITTDDSGEKLMMPRRTNDWIHVRAIMNLNTDDLTLQYWQESDPAGTLVTATREDVLAGCTTFTQVRYKVYNGGGGYQCIDDLRVYVPSTLRLQEVYPNNNSKNKVSVTADPSLIFNMPVENYTGTMTLKDSDGNAVEGTVGLNAQRNGIAFYPTSDLKGEETYTLTANCAVTDVFGSAMNVAKTITFTTEPVLTLVDFEFSSDEVVAGELGASIEVKAEDKLPKNIYAALAIYNKSTGELVSINTGSINAVTNTFNLSAEVPEAGEYYAKAFVWNTDATAVPYFTAQSIGLN